MSARARIVLVLLSAAVMTWAAVAAAQAKPPEEGCVTCHLEIGDDRLMKPAQSEVVYAPYHSSTTACHWSRVFTPTNASRTVLCCGCIREPRIPNLRMWPQVRL